jgi:hypothetical protein
VRAALLKAALGVPSEHRRLGWGFVLAGRVVRAEQAVRAAQGIQAEQGEQGEQAEQAIHAIQAAQAIQAAHEARAAWCEEQEEQEDQVREEGARKVRASSHLSSAAVFIFVVGFFFFGWVLFGCSARPVR